MRLTIANGIQIFMTVVVLAISQTIWLSSHSVLRPSTSQDLWESLPASDERFGKDFWPSTLEDLPHVGRYPHKSCVVQGPSALRLEWHIVCEIAKPMAAMKGCKTFAYLRHAAPSSVGKAPMFHVACHMQNALYTMLEDIYIGPRLSQEVASSD